jgi:pyridinium-3,5-bisthiocarboxylic acid mononucleotide nickel chelatase
MKLLYFDCFNGASGDMILGALLDAGLPLEELRRALGSLGIGEYQLAAERVLRAGVSATKFHLVERATADAPGCGHVSAAAEPAREHAHVHVGPDAAARPPHPHSHGHEHSHSHSPGHEHVHPHSHEHSHEQSHDGPHASAHPHEHSHPHRSLPEILALIERSALPAAGRVRARHLFERLAQAEAAIHQMPIEQVHLHEVGALDSIIDIVGAVFAIEWFGADRILVSPLNVGGGMVQSAHGVFPVPAPATVRLLGDAPIYSSGVQAELLTPTGALLLTGHAAGFGPVPPMRVERVGYGAGGRELAGTPNVLRVLIGESTDRPGTERIAVLECEIDDMNPQIFGVLMDRLYAAGALEVYYSAVQMKKNRPGTLVTVLAPPERREELAGIVFRESTTIGVRHHDVQRERLEREIVTIDTPLGSIRFKVARRDGSVVNASPEFDDCVRIAAERGLPVKDVQAVATRAWLSR